MTNKLKIKAIQCLKCKDVIFSYDRHDFHYCSCGKTVINGGQIDYVKISFDDKTGFKYIDLDLTNVTLKELYDDWNQHKNKFGLIKHK